MKNKTAAEVTTTVKSKQTPVDNSSEKTKNESPANKTAAQSPTKSQTSDTDADKEDVVKDRYSYSGLINAIFLDCHRLSMADFSYVMQ